MLGLRRTGARQIIHDDFHTVSRRRKNRRIIGLVIAALIATVLWVGWQQAHASRHMASDVSLPQVQTDPLLPQQVQAGQLLLKLEKSGDYQPALMLHSSVHFTISGMVSQAAVTQSFRNDTEYWVEAVYLFPLPAKAAVNRLRMTVAERVIEGSIAEREQAKAVYLKAKSNGHKASLLEQQRPNMFTTRVANVGPGETVVVSIDYLQTLDYESGLFSLRFPMTITPRYMPGMPIDRHQQAAPDADQLLSVDQLHGWSIDTDQVSDASVISPFMIPNFSRTQLPVNPISISATIDMGMPLKWLDSTSHDVVSSQDSGKHLQPISTALNHDSYRYHLQLQNNSVSMDRDFILRFQPEVDTQPVAAVFSERVNGEDYALMMIVPPLPQQELLVKEVIYIVDTSGSMGGVSIQQARQALMLALDQLRPDDRFNVIEFNSHTRALFPRAQAAQRANIEHARRFVQRLDASGGTEMLPALEAALGNNIDDTYLRQLVFITDGAVGNEEALLALIHQKLGNSRLFTVAIGSAPNTFFMRKAAQFGRGSLTHISSVTEVREHMSSLFARLSSPAASHLSITWPQGQVTESYPAAIPDLYLNEPLMISAKMPSLAGDIVVTATTAGEHSGQQWQRTLTVPKVAEHNGVATLWAREKIADLLDEKIMGRDAELVRSDVLAVALQHQLLSPYTSFVAVEKTASRNSEDTLVSQPIPNTQPHGQSPQHFAYPRTATTAMQSIVYGIAFLVMTVVFFLMMRRDEQEVMQA